MNEKKEYIDRGALLKQFDEALLTGMAQRAHASGVSEEAIKAALDKTRVVSEIVVQCINAIPAADVEPVVRGEWIEMRDPYGDLTGWIHEECGHETQCASNYCSKCGAKMTFIERSGSGE